MAAQVDGDTLVFRFAEPAGALRGVRLQQDVRLPGDRLDLVRQAGEWVLTVRGPKSTGWSTPSSCSTPTGAASG